MDRVKDRLLAGLEFEYGDIAINPLETSGQKRNDGRILLRDGDQEREIIKLMEQSRFGGILADEMGLGNQESLSALSEDDIRELLMIE